MTATKQIGGTVKMELSNINRMTPGEVPRKGDDVFYRHYSEGKYGDEKIVSGDAKVIDVEWIPGHKHMLWVDITVRFNDCGRRDIQGSNGCRFRAKVIFS
jgi:hypothetical protein